MPRNVEDIIPLKKRSIRDVPVPEERRTRSAKSHDVEAIDIPIRKEEKVYADETPVSREADLPRMKGPLYKETKKKSGGKSRKTMWVSGILVVLVAFIAVFSLLRSATLAYVPKSAELNFQNDAYTAYKTGGEGVLLFSVVKISDTKGLSVPATGESQVSRKASGTIVVYNDASSQSQKLIKNTRFETPEGKVYRVQNDITVPGKTGSNPGTLEVTVYADQAGPAYNIGLTDFTLPGLKGDPRFKTVYARSKTPMSGGFIGMEKSVSPEALTQTKAKLEAALKDSLLEAAKAQVPSDFVLFPSLSTVVFTDMPQTGSSTDSVTINESGNMLAVIFKKSDLTEYIKNKKLSLPISQEIAIIGLDKLTVNFAGTPPEDLLNASQVNVSFSGTATAEWLTNESILKQDLVGVKKSDLGTVLLNYPSIQSADAIIRPFWRTSFPDSVEDITLRKEALK
jgi:hypothetical protein